MNENRKLSNQVVSNIGLFYIGYELSKRGWNVLTTTRNAKGVDMLIYSQNASRTHTIQVKTLSKRNPVPFGDNLDTLIAEFLIICRGVSSKQPEVFIAELSEIKDRMFEGEKNGKKSYWLQPKNYEDLKDVWEKIGTGW